MKRRKMAGAAVLTTVCLLAQSRTMPAYEAGISGSMRRTDGTSRLQDTVPLIGSRDGEAPTGVGLENLEVNPGEGDSASAPVEMKGTIAASLISISLPTDGFKFSIDPEALFDLGTLTAQVLSPDVKIENRSAMSVKLEIARMDDIDDNDVKFSKKFSSEQERSFQLIDTIADANASGTAILVLGIGSRRYQTSRESERYAIYPGKTGIYTAEIEAGGRITLKLYGKIPADFYGSYESTVRSTLKISTVQVNELADSYRE